MNESIVSADEVSDHLRRYRLVTKPPEPPDGGRVLGLSLHRNVDNKLWFYRGNEILMSEDLSELSRRQLFSLCGRLVGHYPVCSWLRVACSFVKRESEGKLRDDCVGERALSMIKEVLNRVRCNDPVHGRWRVRETTAGRVWCDASNLALGVAVEIDGCVVEDATCLRKPSDIGHINVAELDAVLKGVNLALKWKLKSIEIMTDSAIVVSWLNSVLIGDFRAKVTGMSEMFVKRRLSVIKELVDELGLEISVKFVVSCKNRADVLTRVNKTWLRKVAEPICGVSLNDLHTQHHFGVDRSLQLA